MRELRALLILSLTEGVGPRTVAALRETFGSAAEALAAGPREWLRSEVTHRQAPGAGRGGLSATARAEEVLRRCRHSSISLLGVGLADYPPCLAAIADPPPVLYLSGDPSALHACDRMVAVVGTRNASPAGRTFAYRVASELAAGGVVVVSGLALGIDAEAHRGALAAGGKSVAVLPGGLDRVYPQRHRELAETLRHAGALVAEHPPGTPLNRGHFAGRNRIVSGLSRAVLVVEAGKRSGALHTADFAAEQGRAVLAVPGRPWDSRVAGCLALLRDGARLATTAQDVFSELGMAPSAPTGTRDLPQDLLPLGSALADLGTATIDELQEVTGLPLPRLLADLGRLEARGRAVRESDGRYHSLTAGRSLALDKGDD